MSSWERELQRAANAGSLPNLRAILARDEVKRNGDLGRKAWVGVSAPLHIAAWGGRNEMIRVMVEAGFDVNSYEIDFGSGRKLTCLHQAVDWGDKAETVKLLLDFGADPTLKGRRWDAEAPETPLEWARKGRDDVVRILVEYADSSLKSFNALDPVSQLQLKARRGREMEEGKKIQREIEEKKAAIKTLQEEVKGLEEEPSLRNMDEVRRQLEKIEDVEKSVKEALGKEEESCRVCCKFPQQVFVCQVCDHWVCQDCRGKLATCPSCRQNLTAKPLKRNKAVERLMGIP